MHLTKTGTYIQLRYNCRQFKTQGNQHTSSQTGVLTVPQSQTEAFLETWMGPTTSPQRTVLAQRTVTLTLRDRTVIRTLIRSGITARNSVIHSNQVTDNTGLWPDLKSKTQNLRYYLHKSDTKRCPIQTLWNGLCGLPVWRSRRTSSSTGRLGSLAEPWKLSQSVRQV
jgi:hypothetical protein